MYSFVDSPRHCTRQFNWLTFKEKKRHAVLDEHDSDSDYLPPPATKKMTILKKNGDIECIPKDVLMDIFLRIPAQDLHNSVRLVCKSWWNTIHDPYFVKSHLAHSKSHFILQAIDKDERMISTISLKPKQKNIDRGSLNTTAAMSGASLKCCEYHPIIKASCNGLVLILFHHKLIVSNPITKWFIKLPSLGQIYKYRRTTAFGFAYDHSAEEYKVVCSFLESEKLFRCAIHTVGSNLWTEVEMPSKYVTTCRAPVSTSDGTLHWQTGCIPKKDLESGNCIEGRIVSMKLSNEEFRITRNPPTDKRIGDFSYKLIKLGGSLSLIHDTCTEWDVWVLKDYDNEVWVKNYCINITNGSARRLLDGRAFASLYNGEVIIFMCGDNRLFMYDLELQELKEVKAHLRHFEGEVKAHLKYFKAHLRHFKGRYPRRNYMQLPLAHINSLVSVGNIQVKKW